MFENNNKAIVRKITGRTLRSDKRRNFFIIAAIALTTFLIASVFSVGTSFHETINMSEKRLQGSVSNMGFGAPTAEQLEKIYTLDYIKTVGIGAYIAHTYDFPKLHNETRDRLDIGFVDKTQWEEMFSPAYTNIVGHYPEQENEIMLSRYMLNGMGIENPSIGIKIPFTYIVNGTEEAKSETFILSCIYTEYSFSGMGGGGGIAVWTSRAFVEKYGKLTPENTIINIIFKDRGHIDEYIEKLKQDLPFYENQPYIQSPAFDDNSLSAVTYIAILTITVFLMLTGYLLIYNVMYISVSKDVRFYGMLKTIGATPKQIRRIVVGQVLRLCLVGLPAGCAVAAVVSLWVVPSIITSSSDMPVVVSFSPLIYLGAIVFAVLTALFGAATPAKKAARISPVEALKFTGEEIQKQGVRSSVNGRPYKMALRNIFRDRKRAAIVILSLLLGIIVFTSVMTIIASLDIEYRLQNEYDYDFVIITSGRGSFGLDEDFINSAKSLDGVTEAGSTMQGVAELLYASDLVQLIDFNAEDVFISAYGIDRITLDQINKTLPEPIDAEAFERGEIALINTPHTDESVIDALTAGSVLSIKSGKSDVSVTVGSVSDATVQTAGHFGFYGDYANLGIIVSNTLLRQIFMPTPQFAAPPFVRLEMNVNDGMDEQVFNALNGMINPLETVMTSRFGARIAMQDAQMALYVLGGGISAILGFIGIFNFINVMSVGVMTRKREFATLESIGMSKKQMRSMLRNEGLGYAVITIVCALTVGNIMTYGLFLLFKRVADYAKFTYPLIPCMAVFSIIIAICLITSEIAYESISKSTLVERLREAE